ncbi:MAG: aldo/keto reductase [Bacteroidetes bacterium]|nr:aldo/keto reductase [Bacteroidota bacterium]
MTLRKLGDTHIETAPIILGGNVFGWTIDEKQSFEILDSFLDLGFNTIDTADMYSVWADGNQGGESETIIGKWMKSRGNRDKVNIITKVGSDLGQGHKDLSASYISEAVDKSLHRLQTDRIDLYLSHFDDERTPVEETLQTYDKLVQAGKVRYIGASNFSPERLQESLDASRKNGWAKYQVYQPEYNLYDRAGFEESTSPICQKEKLGVINYFSLASGFLTGKYRDKSDRSKSVRGSKVEKYLNDKGHRILHALDSISQKHNTTQAAVSLAWLMESPLITAPIASATQKHHLEAFAEAVKTNLSKEDMDVLNEVSSGITGSKG